MNDKRFIKVKCVNEERYFRNDRELIRFIEKQEGMTWKEMIEMYNRLTVHNAETGKIYLETRMNLNREVLKIGKFLFRIFRGNYDMTSGFYHINILSIQRADLLTGNDIRKIFNINN